LKRLLPFLAFIFVWLLGTAWAGEKNPFLVRAEGTTLAPGGKGNVTLTLVVPPAFHVYRDMMEVKVTDQGGLTLGAPSFPPGEQKPDPLNPGSTREQFEADVIVEVPVTAPAKEGSYTAAFTFRYQGCKDTLCYMPATDAVDAVVQVSAGASAGAAAGGTADAGDASEGEAPPSPDKVVHVSQGPGEAGKVVIAVGLEPGWHVNRDLFGVRTAAEGGLYTLGEADLPAGKPFVDPATDFTRTDIEGDFLVRVPVSGPPGQGALDLLVNIQACKEGLCLMPTDFPLHASVDLGGEAAAPAAEASAPSVGGKDAFAQARDKGLGALLALVFVAGLGVSLTPCVLPMVPITIGIIGARSAGSRIQAISLAATYVLGLAGVYTLLGVGAGVFGWMFGSWMQNVTVVATIALFFFVMGLAMFGLFDIGMPSSVQTKLSQYGGTGYTGAFVIGMVGALVAGPCSGPVLLSIIALISKQGEVGLGALLMAVFSLGMGMIFLVAGAFSSTLLRPGAWMDTVKKSFGLVMWAGALYFLSPHLSDTVTALIASAMLLLTAVYAWPESEEEHGFWVARARKLYTVVGVLVGAYLLLGVLLTKGFILPPVQLASGGAAAAAQGPRIAWGHDEAAALATAKAEGRPVMIDFTADWCAACKELEHLTYTDAGVIEASQGLVPVMIDATRGDDPAVKALIQKYDVGGLPTVKFLRPDGTPIEDLTVTGFLPPADFLPRMQAAAGGGRG